jgi:predicted phage-related endonuclease
MTLNAQQREIRRTRFGGSEFGALLEQDPWKTKWDLFNSKIFGAEEDDEARIHSAWGTDQEPAILANFARRNALEPVPLPDPKTQIHPRYDWICATPDFVGRTVRSSRRMVEAKNVQRENPLFWEWGTPGTDEIPVMIQAQVQVTLGVLLERGLVDDEEADVAVCRAGAPPAGYVVRYSPAFFEGLAHKALRFKEEHLDTGVPPEFDGSKAAGLYLAKRWPKNDATLLEPTDEALVLHTELLLLEATFEPLEERAAAICQRLQAMIGEASGIAGVATWKKDRDSKAVSTDWEALALDLLTEFPEDAQKALLAKHTAERVTREGPRKFRPVRPRKPRGKKEAP